MICFLATREPCSLPYSWYMDSKSECKTSNLSIGEGSVHLSPSKAARIEEKIQGFPCAALPIIKPSAFVFDKALNAELPHLISPLTNTGIPIESLIADMFPLEADLMASIQQLERSSEDAQDQRTTVCLDPVIDAQRQSEQQATSLLGCVKFAANQPAALMIIDAEP